MWRHHLFQNLAYDTLTIRNNVNQEALPMRRLGSFLLGTGVGGAGVHWNAQIWRFLESDLKAYSHNLHRYGKAAVSAYDMTVQDYPLSWSEIEPHYDAFDKLCGTSGKAGNLNGKIQAGGNPFEGPRSAEYPEPAAGDALRADALRPGRARDGLQALPASRPAMSRGPTPIRSARSSGSAPTAASARSSAAATTPRPPRRPRSCPTC